DDAHHDRAGSLLTTDLETLSQGVPTAPEEPCHGLIDDRDMGGPGDVLRCEIPPAKQPGPCRREKPRRDGVDVRPSRLELGNLRYPRHGQRAGLAGLEGNRRGEADPLDPRQTPGP